jgi:glycosyltransferase involved in cell wall biosynthesis
MNPGIKEKNDKLKLMIITPYFYPKVGGLENYAFSIAEGLKEKYDWEIVVITSNHAEKINTEEELHGMKIYKLARWFRVSNTPINPIWYFQIKNIIKKEKPDILNAHTPVPFISDVAAGIYCNIPFILTYHTGTMILKGRFFIDILIRIYESSILKITLKKTKKIICTSDFVKFVFLKDYASKTITVTPGVDINRFKPKESDSKNEILFVGGLSRAERYKGLEYLLSAVSRIKRNIGDIKLTVVGDGDYVRNYKRLCKSLGIMQNVEFKGILTGRELVEQYQKSNVSVQPSLSESFGIVLLEAMACKKPVIGSNIEGIPYIIENGKNGLIVPPKDIDALAEAIIKILTHPELAQEMGEEGYKKVIKNFTWDVQVAKTNSILRSEIK